MRSAREPSTSTLLGLQPDERSWNEFWIGETCFAIWYPTQFGGEFEPQADSIALLHVDDVAAAREALEAKGVEFGGETLTPASATWPSSAIRTATRSSLHSRYAPYTDGPTP